MPHEVIMPALGMAQDTGLIVAWHKAPGDAVKAGDVLFEVETDKAVMEVAAQADGFLCEVRRNAGDDVPVGEVIAMIGETADVMQTDQTPAQAVPEAASVPEGNRVIMPALGMAQDSGLIVAWHKAPGDAVAAGDVLFEVETDKATMEVAAGFDGYVAALLAEAGEAAPVGETIAVISDERPENPVRTSRAKGATAAPPTPAAPPAATETGPAAPAKAPARKAPAPSADGRILASPKARRLALEQGLDLVRLAEAGHPQPYHAADIAVLRSLPAKPTEAARGVTRRLTAELPAEGFSDFAAWAAETAGLSDAAALLAGLAGASLGRTASVAVESFGQTRLYTVPPGPLGDVVRADADSPPDLRLRDLRMTRITAVDLGAEDAPVLTLTGAGKALTITLECADGHLGAAEALALLSDFAGRMEQPLRHLL